MAPDRHIIKDLANTLPRNSACLACRTRKVKCDGGKPVCNRCIKSAGSKGESAAELCHYDDLPEKKARRTNSGPSTKRVNELESKIADLEKILKDNQHGNGGGGSAPSRSQSDSPLEDIPVLSYSSAMDSLQLPGFALNLSSTAATVATNLNASVAPSYDDGFMMDLLYPGYDKELPHPEVLLQLLHVYFTRPHTGTYMIEQGHFMSRLALSPKHADYPDSALLHAMCALAYSVGAQTLSLYWQAADPATKSPVDYHIDKAKRNVDEHLPTCRKLLDLTQAIALLNFSLYVNARFTELWTLCGMAVRTAIPLGLNNLEMCYSDEHGNLTDEAWQEYETPTHTKKYVKHRTNMAVMIPAPKNERERYERAAAFWQAYLCDRLSACSTGFAPAIDEADIFTLLPNGLENNGPLQPPQKWAESLSIWSDTFFVSHPPGVVGPYQLCIKAVVLMARISTFISRSPFPIGRSSKQLVQRLKGAKTTPLDIFRGPEFRQLDSDCISFRLSFHREYKALLNKSELANTAAAHYILIANNIAHVATILLHEPFCTSAPEDESMARSMTSARQILSTIYLLLSSTYDIALFNPFAIFTWQTAARVLIRHLALKQAQQDFEGQATILQEIQVVLGAMQGMRTPLAEYSTMGLRFHLSDPSQFLPPDELGANSFSMTARNPGCAITELMLEDVNRSTPPSAQSSKSPSSASSLNVQTPPAFTSLSDRASPPAMDFFLGSAGLGDPQNKADFNLFPDMAFASSLDLPQAAYPTMDIDWTKL